MAAGAGPRSAPIVVIAGSDTLRRMTFVPERVLACCVAAFLGCASGLAPAATLAQTAKDSGCTDKPVRVAGSDTWKCATRTGAQAFFNVPEASSEPAAPPKSTVTRSVAVPSPAGFPRIDSGTQKSRDDLRRKVLQDELASEEKLLADAKKAWGDGAPPPLPEERANAPAYADRLARLRQAVQLHERNVAALKREIGSR